MLHIFHESKSQNAEFRYFRLEEFQALSETERAEVLSDVFIVKGHSVVIPPRRYFTYDSNLWTLKLTNIVHSTTQNT